MARKRCTGANADGTPCGSQPLRGSNRCRWHPEREDPSQAHHASVNAPLDPSATPNGMIRVGRTPTEADAARLRWYWSLLVSLRALTAQNGQRWPLLEGEFPDNEPVLIVGEHQLPVATVVLFMPNGQLRIAIGDSAYGALRVRAGFKGGFPNIDEGEPIDLADLSDWADAGVSLQVTLIDEYTECPFVAFLTLERHLLVAAHPEVPRAADGLPDLRVLRTPYDQWGTLVAAPQAGAEHGPLAPPPWDGHLTVISAGPYQALREALSKNGFYRVDGVPWPTASLETGKSRGYAQLRPVTADAQPLMSPEEADGWAERMWRQREELSDRDADTLDLLIALWIHQARRPDVDVMGDVDELLAMRGIKRKKNGQGRRGGYEREQRAEMLQSLARIQNLWLDLAQVEIYEEGSRGTGRGVKEAIQSRAIVISDRMGQLRLDGEFDVHRFLFRPGGVFARFVFGPGRQIALLSVKAVQYDPRKQTWEKRLARYLSWQWRIRAHKRAYGQPYRIETLLEAVGATVDPRYPNKTRKRLEKALDTLRDDQVIAAWRYDRLEAGAIEGQGWVTVWLQGTVIIEPPVEVRDVYNEIPPHEAESCSERPAPPGLSSLGERLKRRRQELRLSQTQVGQQVGISQESVSKIERGQKPSSAVRTALEKWLAPRNSRARRRPAPTHRPA